ncbi:MAG: hypothetical protein R3F65_12845 [bacterium]
MQRRLCCWLVVVGALVAGPAWAQSSPVSELWRQWAVLEQAWRLEKAEVEADRARLRARRAEKQQPGDKAPDPPKRGG